MASSASGSSRLLMGCCCVTFMSVLLFSVGFVRLELELRAHKERILTLEQNQQILIPATDTSDTLLYVMFRQCFKPILHHITLVPLQRSIFDILAIFLARFPVLLTN